MFKALLDQAARALARRAPDQWELGLTHSRELSLGVRGKELDKLREAQSLGLSIRVLKDSRPGFSFLLGSDLGRLPQAIDMALASAQAADPVEGFSLAGHLPELESVTESLRLGDAHAEFAPIGREIKRARLMSESALAVSPKISHVYPAETSQSLNQFFLRNSEGLDAHYGHCLVWAGCAAVAEENGQQEEAWEWATARSWQDMDLAGLGQRAGLKAAASLGARPALSGPCPVLLTNQVAAYFVELLSASLKADNIVKGRSLLAGRQGQKILSAQFSLVDNALRPGAPHSRPFDGEGTPSQMTVLFEQGVMQDFIRDRYWGRRLELPSTGNCQRPGLKNPPEVGFSNLMLTPGQMSPEQIIASLERGIIVEQIMGGHTADPVSGQFSLGLVGCLVERGQIVRPIRGNALAGQVLEMGARISQTGSDLQCFGQVWAPCLLIDEMAISGPAG